MSLHYSPSTGGFYRTEVHGGGIPADAVEITAAQHAELMEAQEAGATFAAAPDTGGPTIVPPPEPDLALLQQSVKRQVRTECESRIAEVMPLARQLAVLRDHVLNGATIDQQTLDAFAAADAIEQAAAAIEADVEARPLTDLGTYPVRENALWPAADQL